MNIGELAKFRAGIATDTISEQTAAAGVTVDGVLLKDGQVTASGASGVVTNTITERTSGSGVAIDSVLLKDGAITATGTSSVTISTSNFNNELSATESTVTLALERLDDFDSLLDWATGKAYRVGNVVRVTTEGFMGEWRCISAHTAAAAVTTDINAGYWEIVANSEGSRELVNAASHGFVAGDWLYHTGSAYAKAVNTSYATSRVVGVVSGATTNYFVLAKTGKVTKTGWALTAGAANYLSSTAGASTTTRPTEGYVVPLGMSPSSTTIQLNIDFNDYYEDADPTEIAGIPPSLDLDASVGLPPSVTFTRATTASYFDYDGILKYAASGVCRTDYDPATAALKGWLIEEARTNLLTDTEQFFDSSWTLGQANIANRNAVSVDGTMFASKLIQDSTAASAHFISQSTTLTAASYTLAFFLKAGENTWAKIVLSTTADGSGAGVYFNLGTGAKGTEESGRTGTITAIGGGWYRCTVTATATAATWYSQLLIAEADNDHTISGDGKSGIYFSKAQLEAGAFPTSYIPSAQTFTSRDDGGVAKASYYTSAGLLALATAGAARTTYNPSPDKLHLAPKLLLEPAATNLCLQSEDFGTTWTNTSSSETTNAAVAPDGNTTADKYIPDNGVISGSATILQSITVPTADGVYTYSMYVKKGEYNSSRLLVRDVASSANNVSAFFNCLTGVVSGTPAAGGTYTYISASIQQLPNDWYRCSMTFKIGSDTAISVRQYTYNNGSDSVNGDGTSGIYLWGAQLEAGYGPTSYIPTTTASVTRNADVYTSATYTRNDDQLSMTGTNFTGWYRFDEGTIYCESRHPAVSTYALSISDNTVSNRVILFTGTNVKRLTVTTSGTAQASIDANYTYGTTTKTGITFKVNSFQIADSGTLGTEDTSGSVPTSISRLYLGADAVGGVSLNGHIRRLIFWPARLSNTKLQQMTL